jgi:internalin A
MRKQSFLSIVNNLILLVSVMTFSAQATSVSAGESKNMRFKDWCANADAGALSTPTKELVYQILRHIKTFDCTLAEQELNNLQEIRLFGYFDDLKPLTSVSHITKLEIINNNHRQGTVLEPLSQMINLTHLTIRGYVQNIAPLSSLTNLAYLNLGSNQIQDIQPLANLKNLTYLDIAGNELSGDLTPLASLEKLVVLRVNGRCVNLSPLQSLTSLEVLHVWRSEVTDITPLAKLTNLSVLQLPGNPIQDIQPLASLKQLVELDLRETEVQDRSPLSKLPNLKILRIDESLGLRHADSKRRRCDKAS